MEVENSRDVVAKLQALFPFPAPPPERPGELARRLQAMAVLIKIHFAFDRFPRLQNVAKIKFISIQDRGGLIKGCIFLFTARWAYNCGAYNLKSTVDPPEKRDPAAGYRPGNLTNCFLHPFNSSQLIWK